MPNPTDPNTGQDPKDIDHEHHKSCVYHASRCETCPQPHSDLMERIRELRRELRQDRFGPGGPGANTFKRPTYRHTAKPPWVDFEKQRELIPDLVSGDQVPPDKETSPIRLKEKLTTCRITFDDREPERSDSGKAITIHQCEVHLVIITWDES